MQEETSTPATPSSGKWKIYPKASGYYLIDDNGLEVGPLAPTNGWTPVYDTWTYASANTIIIPTDGTTTYQKGVKIRFKQGGGFKYYIGSTIAATLITVPVNTDYVVANAAITDISYSYVENPYGWPGWFNRDTANTVSGAGGSAGTYAQDIAAAKYCVRGKFILDTIRLRVTNVGSWSGNVRVVRAITGLTSANIVNGGGVWVQAALAPKGLTAVDDLTYFLFYKTYPTAYISWADMLANDWIDIFAEYQF